jgi:hypothetical protein
MSDIFDQIAGRAREDAERERRAQEAVRRAAQRNPDEVARAQRRARSVGLDENIDPAVINRDQRAAFARDFDLLGERTQRYLARPGNADVAQDDTGNLAAIDSLFTLGQGTTWSRAQDRQREARRRAREARIANRGYGSIFRNIGALGPGYIGTALFSAATDPDSREARRRERQAFAADMSLGGVGEALNAGRYRALQGYGGVLTLAADALGQGDSAIGDWARRRTRAFGRAADVARPDVETRFARDIYGGFESVPQSLVALGTTLATGSPLAGAGAMGLLTTGGAYDEARDEGLSFAAATAKSIIDGLIETGTELLPLQRLLGDLPQGSIGRLVLNQFLTEMPTEQVATLGQDLNQFLFIERPQGRALEDYLSAIPDRALSTAISSIVTTGAMTAPVVAARSGPRFNEVAQRVADRITARIARADAQVEAAEGAAELATQIMAVADRSTLRERDPAAFADFIDEMAEGTAGEDIYIDPTQLENVLNQEGLDPETLSGVAAVLGPRIAEARRNGTDVRVPVGDFVTAMSSLGQGAAIVDHIKTDPSGITRAEAQELVQQSGEQLRADIEAVAEQEQAVLERDQSREAVKQAVLGQLQQVNRFTPDVNERYAEAHAAFFDTLAQRLGQSAEELFARFPLRVQAVSPTGAALDQPAPSWDDMLARGREIQGLKAAIRDPQTGEIYTGYSHQAAINKGGDAGGRLSWEWSEETNNVGFVTKDGEFISRGEANNRLGFGYTMEDARDFLRDRGRNARYYQSEPLPDTIEIDGTARPTTNSNGQPIAATEEGVRNFWRWFGDSKVVDEQGRPLVVYHGAPYVKNGPGILDYGKITEFQPTESRRSVGGMGAAYRVTSNAFFFTPNAQLARAFGENRAEYGPGSVALYQTYLKAATPFDMTGDARKVRRRLEAIGIPAVDRFGDTVGAADMWMLLDDKAVLEKLLAAGFDGALLSDSKGARALGVKGKAETVAVFSPEQIKSAIGNSGAFDPNDPNILRQDSPIFYSALERAIEQTKQAKADGQQWLAMISKTPGVKKEELEWTGLPEWLGEQQGAVTRDELLAFVRAGGVQIEEVVYSDDVYANEDAISDLEYQLARDAFLEDFEDQTAQIDVEDDYDRLTIDMFDPDYVIPFAKTWEARFYYPTNTTEQRALARVQEHEEASGATHTGGDSYLVGVFDTEEQAREALTTAQDALFNRLQDMGLFDTAREQAQSRFEPKWRDYVTNPRDGEDYTELLLTLPPGVAGNPTERAPGGHWDPENVVAHVRFDIRDHDGESVLMIHEIQSDWHQAGRDQGYKTEMSAADRAQLEAEIAEAEAEIARLRATPEYVAAAERHAALKGDENFADKQRLAAQQLASDVAGIAFVSAEQDLDALAQQAFDLQIRSGVDPTGQAEPRSLEEIRAALAAFRAADEAREAAREAVRQSGTADAVPFQREIFTQQDRINSARTKLSGGRGVPDAPFKNTGYASLAMKRVIRWAADRGDIDKIAWIRGEQQNGETNAVGGWFYNETNVGKDGKERPGVLLSVTKDLLKKLGANTQIERYYGIDGMEVEDSFDYRYPEEIQMLIETAKADLAITEEELLSAKEAYQQARDSGTATEAEIERLNTAWTDLIDETDRLDIEIVELERELADANEERDKAAGARGHLGFRLTSELETSAKAGMALFQKQRGAYTPATDTITLLQAADLSTFLHESGHFFLEVMSRVASDPNAPQPVKDDFNTLLKWFNVADVAAWQSMTLDQQRDSHEKFARGFEAYLFTGKSPSMRLRDIFRTFRSWLAAIYKRARNLNVTVPPDIRGVFDRMLATDAEIAEAEASRSMEPLFADKAASGMSEDQWRAYQRLGTEATASAEEELSRRSLRDMRWLSNAKSREIDKLKKTAKATRAATKKAVTQEILAEPIYAAITYLKSGKLGDEKVEGPHRLYTTEIKTLYEGEEYAAVMAALTGMTSTENGVHPNQVAELFGFTSGDHLIKEIMAARPMAEEVEGRTEQRMLEDHGDLIDEQAIEQAAERAIHNEARTRFVATELAALAKATNGREKKVDVLANAAKAYAAEAIARVRVRDLRPSLYEAAATRAGKAAQDQMRKGNLVAASAEKRNQLINMHLARAARRAKEDVERGTDYLRSWLQPKPKSSVAPDYVAQITDLLAAIDMRKAVTGRELDRRQSLREWIEKQRELGFEPVLPEDLIETIGRRSWKELTVEELRGVVDAVKNIAHLGRLKQKLLTAKKDRDFAAAVGEIEDSIRFNAVDNIPARMEQNRWIDAARKGVLDFLALHRKFASLARQMDGGQDGGAVWEYFIRPMNAAGDKEVRMRAEATEKLAEILAPVFGGRQMRKKRYIASAGVSLSLEGRMAIALNMGNAVNRERMMMGETWSPEVLDDIASTLTTEQWRVVQQVWDFVDSYWPQIAAKEQRVSGVAPEKVEALPLEVTTSDGEVLSLPGGYYPIKYDADRSSRAEADDAAEAIKGAMLGLYTRATTRRGHTKARVERVQRPVRKDLGVIVQHVNEVIHDLAWHEYLIDANRLLRARAVDNAVRDHYGPEVLRAIRKALEDVAMGDIPPANSFEAVLAHLRAGVTISGMGWSLGTALLQPLGFAQTAVRLGPKWMGVGLARSFGNGWRVDKTVAWVNEQSSMMRDRAATQNREINDIMNQIRSTNGTIDAVRSSFFVLIAKFQMLVDVPTWIGGYEKAIEGGNDHDRAVALADQAVLDSQGGGQIKDLAGIQRGGPLMKLWTNFYSYFNVGYNLAAESVAETRRVGPKRLPLLAVDLILLTVAPAVLAVLIRSLARGDEPEEMWQRAEREALASPLQLMVGGREIAAIITSDGRAGAPAGIVVKQFADVYNQSMQGEADEAFFKSVNNAAGVVLHYPAGQVNRTYNGIVALAEGETNNPLAVFLGPPQ